uniref:Lipocalin n=1 Tax=Rhipicephalus zambeziensis TaxID=60191 RepID=A0A224YNK3_9ACAR
MCIFATNAAAATGSATLAPSAVTDTLSVMAKHLTLTIVFACTQALTVAAVNYCPYSAMSGWQFLNTNAVIHNIKRNYHYTGKRTICPSATTIARDVYNHRVLEYVNYYNITELQWLGFISEFQFFSDKNGEYNIMKTTPRSAGPPAAYKFLYTLHHCSVLELLDIQYGQGGVSKAAAQVPARAEEKKESCGIWINERATAAEIFCCERMLNALCSTEEMEYIYPFHICARTPLKHSFVRRMTHK